MLSNMCLWVMGSTTASISSWISLSNPVRDDSNRQVESEYAPVGCVGCDVVGDESDGWQEIGSGKDNCMIHGASPSPLKIHESLMMEHRCRPPSPTPQRAVAI